MASISPRRRVIAFDDEQRAPEDNDADSRSDGIVRRLLVLRTNG
jgi:hypothetical protein